jgi:hypothetical protein
MLKAYQEKNMSRRLDGKNAIITGAGRGIQRHLPGTD